MMDVLLDLIDREQVDIYDIPIARITDQYLAFLGQAYQHVKHTTPLLSVSGDANSLPVINVPPPPPTATTWRRR